jgi:uncharacterized protein (TIGR02246 family)
LSTQESTTPEADRAGIDHIRDAHVASLNAGDGEGWAALFTQDGVQMPPNAPANVGIESIRGFSQGLLSLFRVEFSLTVDEVRIAGDWAFERGAYRITLHPKAGGGAMGDNGKYITIYERPAGGGWGVARDIWNSDNPPPLLSQD